MGHILLILTMEERNRRKATVLDQERKLSRCSTDETKESEKGAVSGGKRCNENEYQTKTKSKYNEIYLGLGIWTS